MLYTVLGSIGAMLKLAILVFNDVDQVRMSLKDTVTLKHTGRNQGRSAALNVTVNDVTSAVSELMFNIGQDGSPVCGRTQQSINCNECLKELSATLHQQV